MYSILIYSIFCVSYMILGCKYNVLFVFFLKIFKQKGKKTYVFLFLSMYKTNQTKNYLKSKGLYS